MGSYGNALAVAFFRRFARLRSSAHDFHYIIEKRCGKLGRYVSFNEIHVLYSKVLTYTVVVNNQVHHPFHFVNQFRWFPLQSLQLSWDWAAIYNRETLLKNLERFGYLVPIYECFDDYTCNRPGITLLHGLESLVAFTQPPYRCGPIIANFASLHKRLFLHF